MVDAFRPVLPFRVGDRVRTLAGQAGLIERIESNILTVYLESGARILVSIMDVVLEQAKPDDTPPRGDGDAH